MSFSGVVWRSLPAGGSALHAGYILKARGRWNRAGIYGCLYTSLSREGALAEFEKYARVAGVLSEDLHPHDLVSIRVRVEPVLNLTKEAVRRRIGVSLEALTSDEPADLEACRSVADLARQQGYCGILSPSTALAGAVNLNLYIDGPARNYDLAHGPDRIPINY